MPLILPKMKHGFSCIKMRDMTIHQCIEKQCWIVIIVKILQYIHLNFINNRVPEFRVFFLTSNCKSVSSPYSYRAQTIG